MIRRRLALALLVLTTAAIAACTNPTAPQPEIPGEVNADAGVYAGSDT